MKAPADGLGELLDTAGADDDIHVELGTREEKYEESDADDPGTLGLGDGLEDGAAPDGDMLADGGGLLPIGRVEEGDHQREKDEDMELLAGAPEDKAHIELLQAGEDEAHMELLHGAEGEDDIELAQLIDDAGDDGQGLELLGLGRGAMELDGIAELAEDMALEATCELDIIIDELGHGALLDIAIELDIIAIELDEGAAPLDIAIAIDIVLVGDGDGATLEMAGDEALFELSPELDITEEENEGTSGMLDDEAMLRAEDEELVAVDIAIDMLGEELDAATEGDIIELVPDELGLILDDISADDDARLLLAIALVVLEPAAVGLDTIIEALLLTEGDAELLMAPEAVDDDIPGAIMLLVDMPMLEVGRALLLRLAGEDEASAEELLGGIEDRVELDIHETPLLMAELDDGDITELIADDDGDIIELIADDGEVIELIADEVDGHSLLAIEDSVGTEDIEDVLRDGAGDEDDTAELITPALLDETLVGIEVLGDCTDDVLRAGLDQEEEAVLGPADVIVGAELETEAEALVEESVGEILLMLGDIAADVVGEDEEGSAEETIPEEYEEVVPSFPALLDDVEGAALDAIEEWLSVERPLEVAALLSPIAIGDELGASDEALGEDDVEGLAASDDTEDEEATVMLGLLSEDAEAELAGSLVAVTDELLGPALDELLSTTLDELLSTTLDELLGA